MQVSVTQNDSNDRTMPRTGWPFALMGNRGLIAGIWVLSDLGCHYGLPALSYDTNYNHDPIAAAACYLFWVGVAVITFSRTSASWRSVSQWEMFENRTVSLVLWSVFFALAITFTAYILPGLPPFQWQPEWGPVPDLPQAKPTYFLPKSFDILFQQILILALVLSPAQEGYSLRRISLTCGALFGAVHLVLMFDSVGWSFVLRFVVAGALFGLIFPVLILRMRNGLAFSYALHWFYYALTVFMARAVGPEAIWPTVQKALGLG